MELMVHVADYGYTKSIVDGCIYAYKNGIVNATSLIATVDDEKIKYAADKAKENPGLSIGVHLTLTYGNPCTNGKSITKNGKFYSKEEIDFDKLDLNEVYNELMAQIERYKSYFGTMPTHIDSHHFMFGYGKAAPIKSVMEKIAETTGLPVRGTSTEKYHFVTDIPELYGDTFTMENVKQMLLSNINLPALDWGNHVGFIDLDLYKASSYTIDRLKECEIICSDELRKFIDDNNIILSAY